MSLSSSFLIVIVILISLIVIVIIIPHRHRHRHHFSSFLFLIVVGMSVCVAVTLDLVCARFLCSYETEPATFFPKMKRAGLSALSEKNKVPKIQVEGSVHENPDEPDQECGWSSCSSDYADPEVHQASLCNRVQWEFHDKTWWRGCYMQSRIEDAYLAWNKLGSHLRTQFWLQWRDCVFYYNFRKMRQKSFLRDHYGGLHLRSVRSIRRIIVLAEEDALSYVG